MIFVDTSFWVALQLPHDDYHDEAARLLRGHGDQPLVTTNHIRGETWTFLRRRAGHRVAVRFLDVVDRSTRLDILHIDDDLEREALRWLRGHDEREYSFVDATSFAIMRKRRIGEASVAAAIDRETRAQAITLRRGRIPTGDRRRSGGAPPHPPPRLAGSRAPSRRPRPARRP